MKTNYGKFIKMQLNHNEEMVDKTGKAMNGISIGFFDKCNVQIRQKNKLLKAQEKMTIVAGMEYLLNDEDYKVITPPIKSKLLEIMTNDFKSCDEIVAKVLESNDNLMEALVTELKKYDKDLYIESLILNRRSKTIDDNIKIAIDRLSVNISHDDQCFNNVLTWLDFIRENISYSSNVYNFLMLNSNLDEFVLLLANSKFTEGLNKLLKLKRKDTKKISELMYVVDQFILYFTDGGKTIRTPITTNAKFYVNHQEKIRLSLEKGCK